VSACAGFEVLVGRNNRQNDVLTNRVATDYDLWFHARNIPGCHVTYISLSFPDSSFIEQLVSPDFSKVPPTHLSSF
jgi:predicted ribosome quality control (RQC) complex YloA/Tae2 family protein